MIGKGCKYQCTDFFFSDICKDFQKNVFVFFYFVISEFEDNLEMKLFGKYLRHGKMWKR